MFDILLCISDHHSIQLVALAGVVCVLTSATAVLMVRQMVRSGPRAARAWLLAAGFATGFGIWATHFIAMLGYDPGVVAGYRPLLTLGSLGVVIVTTIAGFGLAARCRGPGCYAAGAIISGSGFAAMHYIGMAALEMPAEIRWRAGYVALSCALAILPLFPAMFLAAARRSAASAAVAVFLLTLAILGLHFGGMTAIQLVPAPMHAGALLISPGVMSALVGVVSLAMLGMCYVGWLISRRTSAAIAASQRQFSILVKGIADCAIYMLDSAGRVANWNAGAQRLKGYTEAEVVGLPLATFYTAEDRARGVPTKAIETARTAGKFTDEGWRVRKDGSSFWAHVTIEQIRDEAGQFIGLAKITRDMTRFKEDQDRIKAASLQLDAALAHMRQGLCLFDAEGRLVLHNRRFCEIWHLPATYCLEGNTFEEVARAALEARTGAGVQKERLDRLRTTLAEALADPESPAAEYDLTDDFSVSISSRATADGGWVSTIEDISERRRAEARIRHLVHHDALTGLPNRASFNRWLDRELEQAGARHRKLAVMMIDLDHFKDVNDKHGHATGDATLLRLARTIDSVLGDGELAARLGGDEFAVAKHFSHAHELTDFTARLEGCFQPSSDDGEAVLVEASLGIAVFPDDGQRREILLNNADLAMYRAKESPGQSLCYYEQGMDEAARRWRQLAGDLKKAVERGEMYLLYQEQRRIRTGKLSGYEALLRWRHPRLGLIGPDEFIPIAEETGEIIRIGEWVLRAAASEAAGWPDDLMLAVNLSPVQLRRPDLPEMVAQVLVQTGLPPRRLELEITETAIISDKLRALHSLRRIKALGIQVAMDDFGTGYSSLDTLHAFPFDKIKIDKSFLLKSEGSPQARAIIRAVLALGRSIGIPVLAEGVETEAHLALLATEGCDEAQGYYFGRPGAAPSSGGKLSAAG